MDQSPLHERITDQFSYRGERADIWRAFDLLLDTDEFLNQVGTTQMNRLAVSRVALLPARPI